MVRAALVSDGSRSLLWKVLVFAAVVEIGTGVAFMADPAIVVTLLLGADVAGVGVLLGRCFGIALLALGLACWPSRGSETSNRAAVRAMLIYNVLIAAYLAWLGTAAHMSGILLWPAIVLHAGVPLLLAWTQRDASSTREADK
jgi:hypothetical protein